MKALDPIRSQLNVDWTDYLDDPQGFYNHEWSKHGTCSYVCFSKLYFSTAS